MLASNVTLRPTAIREKFVCTCMELDDVAAYKGEHLLEAGVGLQQIIEAIESWECLSYLTISFDEFLKSFNVIAGDL